MRNAAIQVGITAGQVIRSAMPRRDRPKTRPTSISLRSTPWIARQQAEIDREEHAQRDQGQLRRLENAQPQDEQRDPGDGGDGAQGLDRGIEQPERPGAGAAQHAEQRAGRGADERTRWITRCMVAATCVHSSPGPRQRPGGLRQPRGRRHQPARRQAVAHRQFPAHGEGGRHEQAGQPRRRPHAPMALP